MPHTTKHDKNAEFDATAFIDTSFDKIVYHQDNIRVSTKKSKYFHMFISTISLLLFEKKEAKAESFREVPFLEIKSISIDKNKLIIELDQNDVIKISPKSSDCNIKNLGNIIYTHVHGLMDIDADFEIVDVKDKIEFVSLGRLLCLSKKYKIKYDKKELLNFKERLKDIYDNRVEELDVDEFNELSLYFEQLLFAISYDEKIKHIKLSKNGDEKWPYMKNFFGKQEDEKPKYELKAKYNNNMSSKFNSKNKYIKKLTICVPLDSGFDKFCDFLDEKVKFDSINFENIKIGTVKSIQKIVFQHSLHQLSLKNVSLSPKAEQEFILMINDTKSKLGSISINGLPLNDNLSLVESCFAKFSSISLISVGIEISSLINYLSKSNVVTCDFSGNPCNEPINLKNQFPLTFQSIYLNNIEWNPSNLNSIITLSSNFSKKHFIVLSNCKMDQNSWETFFENEKHGSNNLIGFAWINNPIHKNLFDFLLKCKHLRFLSLGKSQKFDNSLIEYINETNIEIIDIHNLFREHSPHLNEVLDALISNKKKIKRIDISYNNLNEDNLQKLTELLQVPKINEVLFDGNNFDSKMLTSISQILKQREDLIVYLPKQSISKIIIPDEEYNIIYPCFRGNVKKSSTHEEPYSNFLESCNHGTYLFDEEITDKPPPVKKPAKKPNFLPTPELKCRSVGDLSKFNFRPLTPENNNNNENKNFKINWDFDFVNIEPVFDTAKIQTEMKSMFTFDKCLNKLKSTNT